jgi:hypothetical protein
MRGGGATETGPVRIVVRRPDADLGEITDTGSFLFNREIGVSILEPRPKSRFIAPATIRIKIIAATRHGQITKVEFLADNQVIATLTKLPFEYEWTRASVGKHSLIVHVVDETGASAMSDTIEIEVSARRDGTNVTPETAAFSSRAKSRS